MARRLLMGNEAFAHAALEAGASVFAGYPGTPSSEVIETVARLHTAGAAHGIHVEWSTNEKAALELVAAAAMSGKRALFTCKQVGLNVASDALMSLNYVGVRGGLVLFVADDPGPISSQTEQDTRRFAAFAKVPVFDPSTPEEGFAMMKAAFDLSERYGRPVIVRPTTRIDHASTFIDVLDETDAATACAHAREQMRARGDGDADAAVAADAAGAAATETGDDVGFVRDPARFVIFPKRSYQAHLEITDCLRAIAHDFAHDETYARFNPVRDVAPQGEGAPATATDAPATATPEETPVHLGLVCGGDSAAYLREALSVLGEEAASCGKALPAYRILQVGTPYPAPISTIDDFLTGLSDVLTYEELDTVLEEELVKIAGTAGKPVTIHGKLTGEANLAGENSTEDALVRVARFFDTYAATAGDVDAATPATTIAATASDAGAPATPAAPGPLEQVALSLVDPAEVFAFDGALPPRPPNLCAGCPHRASFYAVKRALRQLGVKRDDAIFCGDIGCYTLGNAAPLDAVDTCLCMGAGITMAQGFATANPGKKAIAFVGDSTFFASGLTGLVNAVYNKHDVTVCILDNSTTAMTGMQPHPGTGLTLMGTRSTPVDIPGLLRAIGIDGEALVIADPLDLEGAQAACVQALSVEGPSAIIFKSPCIWLQKPGRAVAIDKDACTGCRRCMSEIGCPALSLDCDARGPKSRDRGQARVDAALCTGCGLCVQVCPTGAILTGGVEAGARAGADEAAEAGAREGAREGADEPGGEPSAPQAASASSAAKGGGAR